MFDIQCLSIDSIAAVFDDSRHCVKIVSPRGRLLWMNRGGLCAMEIEAFDLVRGGDWPGFWPEETRPALRAALSADPPRPVHLTAPCPTAKGAPRIWDVSIVPVRRSDGRPGGFVVTSRDVTEREAAATTREVLLQEMRHRQGNTLTLAGTLMQVHALGRPELGDFVSEMGDRLAALGRAQNVVARPDRGQAEPVAAATLLRVLTQPLAGPGCALTIDVAGDLSIADEAVDVVGVVLSELAVNASKHGAFRHGGRVAVAAAREPGGLLIRWDEEGTRPVARQAREGGQGLALMTRIARVNDAEFDVAWRPRGQVATLFLRRPGG